MKKTQKKILNNAILLFNRKGVSNTRLQDIASNTGISPGNLSYHYKTKKDLIEAVLELMVVTMMEMSGKNMTLVEQNDYLSIIKNYLRYQIGHRFFYRDILEITNLVPEAKTIFKNQMHQVLSFTQNGLYLAIGKGLIKPEPYLGHYEFFAKNIWAILNSWLVEREVIGIKEVSMQKVILAIWEFHYPYFTDKGLEIYIEVKKQLPNMIEEEEKYQVA